MKTLNISLTDSLDAYLQQRLEAGTYASVSEVVREALRAMQQRDEQTLELRAAIRRGLASGKGRSLDELSVEGVAKRAHRGRKRATAR